MLGASGEDLIQQSRCISVCSAVLTSQAVNEITSFRSQEVVEETCVCSFLFPHVQLETFIASTNGKHEINPKEIQRWEI